MKRRMPLSVLNEAVIWLAGRTAFVQDIVENVEWNRQAAPLDPRNREARFLSGFHRPF
ncbi:MAG: hypothetical protein ACREQZ_02175 [Woeseiaceae bacterium]